MEKLSDHLYIPPMSEVLRERDRDRRAAKKPAKMKRLYSAARPSRNNSSWTTTPYSANWSLYQDLRRMRARARDMCANAPLFRNFLNLAKSNVIGSRGIKLQCNALLATKEPNTRINSMVEEAFWKWSHRETCSVSGKLNWLAAQRLFIETLLRDGEVLVQHVQADNEFGYALKFWNVDYLDETFNEVRPNGNRVIMSVEVDANDRPVAYWLTTPASDVNFTLRRVRERVRVDASVMTHAGIITDEETQTRYVTSFAAVLLEGKNLEGYKEGVITSARFAANSFGFLETTAEDEFGPIAPDPEYDEDGNEIQSDEIEIDASPLTFNELPPGMKMNQFDPKQPTQNHAEFHWTIVKELAAGLGLNGFSLAGDMSKVNFSSARLGLQAERDLWRTLQEITAQTFCRDTYHHFLRNSTMTGYLTLDARQYAELQNPDWQGRGWPYHDPLKDVNAASIAIANGLSTYTDELAVLGIDFEDHIKKIAREQKMMEKSGIKLEIKSVGQPSAEEPPEEEEDEAKPPQDDGERAYTNGKYAN